MKSRTFVIGDIHGRIEALKQCLQRSNFNKDSDKLIVLGDIVDGGYNTYEVVEELLTIKNLIYVVGNHDEWFMNNIRSGWAEEVWLQQGGANTLRSYGADVKEGEYISDKSNVNTRGLNIPVTHQNFFDKGIYYYIENNKLFIHAGINPKIPKIESQSKFDLIWDRNLINWCRKGNIIPNYDEVYIGHSTTQHIMDNRDYMKPVRFGNLWCLDTGAGWYGKLTIMNIKTKEFWQSDIQNPAIKPLKKQPKAPGSIGNGRLYEEVITNADNDM